MTARDLKRRQAELSRLEALMRKPGSLPALPPPLPLHKMGAARGKREVSGDGEDMRVTTARS